ncbi:hypothetical protein ACOMHN_022983 [Nucella lapillus]
MTRRAQRNCIYCAQNGVLTSSGHRVQTSYECAACELYLGGPVKAFRRWSSHCGKKEEEEAGGDYPVRDTTISQASHTLNA